MNLKFHIFNMYKISIVKDNNLLFALLSFIHTHRNYFEESSWQYNINDCIIQTQS